MNPPTFSARRWAPGFAYVSLAAGGWTPGAVPAVEPRADVWLVFAQEDALAAPNLERVVSIAAAARPDVGVFYADDAALGDAPRRRLKPAFNLPLLASDDYIGAPLFVRASVLSRLGLRPAMGEAALYDLVLRAHAAGVVIERLTSTLLAYPGLRPLVPVADRRKALEAWAAGGPFEVAEGRVAGTLQLKRRFSEFPAVTLVVPTCQSAGPGGDRPLVAGLLDGLAKLDWPMDRLHVLVGDDSDDAGTFEPSRWPFSLRRVVTTRPPGEPFSYAAKMNRLWPMAETEHLVLLNDDVRITTPDWLRALLTFSMEEDVGGVGARLLFPDGRLQHAGVVLGLFDGVAHAWMGQPGDAPTYGHWAEVHRDWSVVTGAVFATRRSVMQAAAGFHERFSIELNDVDLALRLRLMGYRIVCTPFAEAVHPEKSSRGEAPVAAEQMALFFARWRDYVADDPAYHTGLIRDGFVVAPRDEPDWLDQ